jgi:hypothetical protein
VFTFLGVFAFLSDSSCVDLPVLYDAVVQLLFNSGLDGNATTQVMEYGHEIRIMECKEFV